MSGVLYSMVSCQKMNDMLHWGLSNKLNSIGIKLCNGSCPDPRTDGYGFRAIIDNKELFALTQNHIEFSFDYFISADETQYRLAIAEPLCLLYKDLTSPLIRDSIALVDLVLDFESDEPLYEGQRFVFTSENHTYNHRLRLDYKKYLGGKLSPLYGFTGIGEAILTEIDNTNCHFAIDAVFVDNLSSGDPIKLTNGLLICPYKYKGKYIKGTYYYE